MPSPAPITLAALVGLDRYHVERRIRDIGGLQLSGERRRNQHAGGYSRRYCSHGEPRASMIRCAPAMLKKIAIVLFAAFLILVGTGVLMYFVNAAPVAPAISAAEASDPGRPFVVKLHSQWCHLCLITTQAWSQIEKEYAGRVNFLVL